MVAPPGEDEVLHWQTSSAPGNASGGASADLMTHLGEWNVWWRLMVIPLIIFYAVLSTVLPYRWHF